MSQSNKVGTYKDIITALADSYSDLKSLLKNESMQDFFGLRDFYSLIKSVSISLIDDEM